MSVQALSSCRFWWEKFCRFKFGHFSSDYS